MASPPPEEALLEQLFSESQVDDPKALAEHLKQAEANGCRGNRLLHKGQMECRDGPAGRGWFAESDIPAGTVLLVNKPLAFVTEQTVDANTPEEDEDESMDEDKEAPHAACAELIVSLARRLKSEPKLLEEVKALFPRTPQETKKLGKWTSHDEALDKKADAALCEVKGLKENAAERERIKWAVRLNELGVKDCAEQMCHRTLYKDCGGVGLYKEASFFNHSSTPNVSRYSLGPAAVFVTNREVSKGTELCISYIEHEFLGEPKHILQIELGQRDFKLHEEQEGEELDERLVLLDPETQAELSSMPAKQRIAAMEQLLDEESHKDESGVARPVLFKDRLELCCSLAFAYCQLNDFQRAAAHWAMAVQMLRQEPGIPPHEEGQVCFALQAARAASASGSKELVQMWLKQALRIHRVAFGGGASFFKLRYAREVSETAQHYKGKGFALLNTEFNALSDIFHGQESEESEEDEEEMLDAEGAAEMDKQVRKRKAGDENGGGQQLSGDELLKAKLAELAERLGVPGAGTPEYKRRRCGPKKAAFLGMCYRKFWGWRKVPLEDILRS